MPALEPVPGVARVVISGTCAGQTIINVFHVQKGPSSGVPFSQADVDTLATGMDTAYKNNFANKMNSGYSGDLVEVTDLSSATSAVGSTANTGTGSGAGTTVPNSVASCISWRISRHYRGGHPRTYLGPPPATAIEGPTSFTPTWVTGLATSANAFRTAVNAIVLPSGAVNAILVTVHRYQNKIKLTPPQVSGIVSGSADSRIDTMRRRLGPDR